MTKPTVIERLSPRQGKVLRIVAMTAVQPVTVDRCVHPMPWSDLPKTDMQARKALDVLRRFGLVERVDKNTYTATEAGRAVIVHANKEKLWQTPPPPDKTNNPIHISKTLKGHKRK